LRTPTHDSGPPWFATPSMSGVLIPFLVPVYPGAPHVPCQSPNQARAASMPDTAWAVDRTPPRLIPKGNLPLGSDVICSLSTRHQRFALAHLLDSHLTCSWHAFSATLTTPALDRRSLRWFGTSPCRATPEDLPPSLAQHRIRRTIFYIGSSLNVRGTQASTSSSSSFPARLRDGPIRSRSASFRSTAIASSASSSSSCWRSDGLATPTVYQQSRARWWTITLSARNRPEWLPSSSTRTGRPLLWL